MENITQNATNQPERPKPDSIGNCSRDCPFFYIERTEGWPSTQNCYTWSDDLDGKEPYYLIGNQCRPALRLLDQPPGS